MHIQEYRNIIQSSIPIKRESNINAYNTHAQLNSIIMVSLMAMWFVQSLKNLLSLSFLVTFQ